VNHPEPLYLSDLIARTERILSALRAAGIPEDEALTAHALMHLGITAALDAVEPQFRAAPNFNPDRSSLLHAAQYISQVTGEAISAVYARRREAIAELEQDG
jgi:hypothetical protein